MFGLSRDDFQQIIECRELILKNKDNDPLSLALKGLSSNICTQIKYLQRCKTKLPEYYAVSAIIPPVSYEQSSSWLTVGTRKYSGLSCLDLTCGLGADTYNFSKHFDSVITIERDELLADIARYNFGLLGADNINVVCGDSTDFVNEYKGEAFDLVFVDPARRNTDERFFSFEQSSPNIIELLPRLKQISKRIVIKSSPMFDNAMAFELFGDNVVLQTVSVAGECKELIIDIDSNQKSKEIVTLVNRQNQIANYEFENSVDVQCAGEFDMNCEFSYLLLPDVAFVKSRKVCSLFEKFLAKDSSMFFNSHLALSNSKIDVPALRCFEIIGCEPYKPKQILSYLKDNKIKTATVLLRDFDIPIDKIRSTLKIKDGKQIILFFTVICSQRVVFYLKTA